MGTRLSPLEKLRRYCHQAGDFERNDGWNVGRYSVSDFLLFLIIGIWFAYFLPQIIEPGLLSQIGLILIVLYILYLFVLFILSGGRGRVVDVI
jgi:hypothetical protein